MTEPDPRTVRRWCLYDFGNSAFAVLFAPLFGVFYTGVVVADPAKSDLWWGLIGSTAMLLVVLLAPPLGGIADFAGVRKRMLATMTSLGMLACLAFGLLEPGWVLAGFVFAVVAEFAFEGGQVFYNSYLPNIAPPSHQGRVSARGFATGYAGSAVALIVAAPLAHLELWPLVWVALAAQWGTAAWFSLRGLPPDVPGARGFRASAREGLARTWRTLLEVRRDRPLFLFLVAAFFFMNGVNTVIYFSGVYAKKTFAFSDLQLILLIGLVQVTALVGSLLVARPTDTRGPRFVVKGLLVWWVAAVVASAFVPNATGFFVVGGVAGLGLGGIQAASRAFMSRLTPKGKEAETFALYALCGRTGSVVGPALFGAISALAGGDQRPAVLSVAAYFTIGFVLLTRVRPPPPVGAAD